MHRLFIRAATIALALGAVSPGVHASTMVLGDGVANACAARTIAGEQSQALVDTCTTAIDHELLRVGDLGRTYVNRAIVLTRRGALAPAWRDLERAERLVPGVGEVYVNRGVILIHQKRFADAIEQTSKGMALGIDEPEKAHFNRAVAREALDDVYGAYLDYLKASQLNPSWDMPHTELARFTVTPK